MFAKNSVQYRHLSPRPGFRTLLPNPYSLPPAGAARKGVLLLVVLSLLVLFVMIALTYVLVATRHLQANRSYGRVGTTGQPPQELLDAAVMQVARGAPGNGTATAGGVPGSPIHSVIGPWSLLEHMYGPYTAKGVVNSTIADATGGKVIEFDVDVTGGKMTASDPAFSLTSSA